MPVRGGSSTQSGILYQNSVATEFIVSMLLSEDDIEFVQVEAQEPIGDIILFRKDGPNSYLQVKEHSPSGEWTSSKLQKEEFWVSSKNQLKNDKTAQIWLVTASASHSLRELTDRARQFQNLYEFTEKISKTRYLQRQLSQVSTFFKCEISDVYYYLKHIYIKESFGSTLTIAERVKNRIQGPKGEDVFTILRDTIAEGAGVGKKFSRDDTKIILAQHGLFTIRSVEKALVTVNIAQLSLKCSSSLKNTIQNKIREKYLPDLFVSRHVQEEIVGTLLRTPTQIADLFNEILLIVKEYKRTFPQRQKKYLTSEQIGLFTDKYSILENKVNDIVYQLQNDNEIDWLQEKISLEKMISNLNDPEGDNLVTHIRRAINNVAIVVDKAGRGKTNILCKLSTELSDKHLITFFIGSDLRLKGKTDLLEMVSNSLGFSNESELSQWFKPLNYNLREQQRYLIVVIDAVNESQDWEILKQNIEELVILTYNHNIRVLFSCRDLHWEGYFHNKNDIIDQYTSAVVYLGDFTPDEFSEVLPKYCAYFHVKIEGLSDEAILALRHPLLLRFFCEAYGDKLGPISTIALISHIRLKKLFDDYWDKKCESIRKKLRHRSSIEINTFLNSLSLAMLKNENRYISLKDLPAITGESDLQTENSKYVAILDEDVILEQSPINDEPFTAFTYDEFMEYILARSLLPSLNRGEYKTLISQLIKILSINRKFPNAIGTVGYLSVMLKEQYDISVWAPLINHYPIWYLTAIRSCSQLDENLWDSEVYSVVNKLVSISCNKPTDKEMYNDLIYLSERITKHDSQASIPIWSTWLNEGHATARNKAGEILSTLSNNGNESALRCLLDSLSSDNDYVVGTVVNRLGNIDNETVPRYLCKYITHKDAIVRHSIAYCLGLFKPSPDIRLALLNMLYDTDLDVRLNAATSLLLDPHESVGEYLNIISNSLSDVYTKYYFKYTSDASKYGDIINKMGKIWTQLHSEKNSKKIIPIIFNGRFNDDILQRIRILSEIIVHNNIKDIATTEFIANLISYGEKH